MFVCLFLLITFIEQGCTYTLVRPIPLLRYNLTTIQSVQVQNGTNIIGFEDTVRRHLESVLIDYLPPSHRETTEKKGHLGVQITHFEVKSTGFLIGQGQSLKVNKDKLLASQYTVTLYIVVTLTHPTEGIFHRSEHVHTESFTASVLDSDRVGASRNELLNILRLEDKMEVVSRHLAQTVFNVITSPF